ncbi:hypothetical protein GQ55_9G177000 [Panicum hallii var. hallii]|jgi:hypothetical protein|uniref:Uncharacterized protein n=2 Tax=Panicum hallii TaxID=206008 RepID=A0A2T7C4E0_9POAL|nr:uncharacterized protein LOC112876829 [Panicum hallii]PAN46380.1 hypothetical protein PAHAL_9G181800 [Panicum hallii]PUZ38186.1 hypothetical protein GQ55_9G177000 [Panicum hallii var. hallii]
MAAPVEVGARGTVGSLVLREVEYFRRVEVAGGGGHGKKSSSKVAASGGGSPRSSSSKKQQMRKKKGGAGSGPFLPRMCSSAEVAEDPGSGGGRRERPARVRYRPLGEEGDALPQED